jgi:hypothetical protein
MVEHLGRQYAIVIRSSFEPPGVRFLTPPENPMQVGVMNHAKGATVKPHVHKKSPRTIKEIHEVLFINRGRVLAKFYDDTNRAVSQVVLDAGDTIILMAGGHGFEFLEATKMTEVKQGPYGGIDMDKTLF